MHYALWNWMQEQVSNKSMKSKWERKKNVEKEWDWCEIVLGVELFLTWACTDSHIQFLTRSTFACFLLYCLTMYRILVRHSTSLGIIILSRDCLTFAFSWDLDTMLKFLGLGDASFLVYGCVALARHGPSSPQSWWQQHNEKQNVENGKSRHFFFNVEIGKLWNEMNTLQIHMT